MNRREFSRLSGQGIAAAVMSRKRSQLSECPKHEDVTLDAMIGQMLLVGFKGSEVNDEHPKKRSL